MGRPVLSRVGARHLSRLFLMKRQKADNAATEHTGSDDEETDVPRTAGHDVGNDLNIEFALEHIIAKALRPMPPTLKAATTKTLEEEEEGVIEKVAERAKYE